MSESDMIMTISEVADYLRIPKSTLYKLCQGGNIPASKVGKHWRFRKDEIDQWFKKIRNNNQGTKDRRYKPVQKTK